MTIQFCFIVKSFFIIDVKRTACKSIQQTNVSTPALLNEMIAISLSQIWRFEHLPSVPHASTRHARLYYHSRVRHKCRIDICEDEIKPSKAHKKCLSELGESGDAVHFLNKGSRYSFEELIFQKCNGKRYKRLKNSPTHNFFYVLFEMIVHVLALFWLAAR